MRARTTTHGVLVAALCALITGVALLALITGFSPDPALRALELLAVVAFGAMIIGGTIVLALVRLAGWRSSDSDFERIVQRAEELAAQDRWGGSDGEVYDAFADGFGDDDEYEPSAQNGYAPPAPGYAGLDGFAPSGHGDHSLAQPSDEADDDAEFRALVRGAIDELPLEFTHALEHVAIVVADGGAAVSVGNGRRGAYGLYQGDTVAQDYFHDRIVIFRDTLMRDFGHDPELLRQQVTRTVRHELAHHLGYGEDGVRRLGL